MTFFNSSNDVRLYCIFIFFGTRYLVVFFLVIDHLSARMQQHSVNVAYDHTNGDQNDEEFEDAD